MPLNTCESNRAKHNSDRRTSPSSVSDGGDCVCVCLCCFCFSIDHDRPPQARAASLCLAGHGPIVEGTVR
ncbi:MAG: hypothetical protein DWH97_04900 [Planctomycetota bacterium]|nr:MAG: hypothetical protein DWH97_04900 [Planctomycetota bacterium]RLS96069.1 MAG: hypothetical protein DWI12_03070 [Planctomycetota bacterium]